MYERTIGCIGILKDWLTRSLKLALEKKEYVLEIEHLRQTAMSINKISKLVEEVSQGEACFMEDQEKILDVRVKLGIDNEKVKNKKTVRKGNVGVRNPKRDKVGEVEDGY
ncbi:hypothetical protein [Bacillus sp. 123MFChir2]|uniref:hypothetical protein n=1 Tax=Bacillus sp. 123MFChir2 TaxID=1169144 RepID=UPI001E28FC79|nr:hypothetical protein [Bacillus sp. 123MFChir2]